MSFINDVWVTDINVSDLKLYLKLIIDKQVHEMTRSCPRHRLCSIVGRFSLDRLHLYWSKWIIGLVCWFSFWIYLIMQPVFNEPD